jgi:hypothetical protein
MSQAPEDGQLHTLGLLEQLREECQQLWGTSSEFYFRIDALLRELADPNLHDIPTRLPFRVELWDRHDQHIRWGHCSISERCSWPRRVGRRYRILPGPAFHASQWHTGHSRACSKICSVNRRGVANQPQRRGWVAGNAIWYN